MEPQINFVDSYKALMSIDEITIDRTEIIPRIRLLSSGALLVEFRASTTKSSKSLDGTFENLRLEKREDAPAATSKPAPALVPPSGGVVVPRPVQTAFPGCAPKQRTYTTPRAPHGSPIKPPRNIVALFRRLTKAYRKGDTKHLRDLVKASRIGERTVFRIADGQDHMGKESLRRVREYLKWNPPAV